MMDNRRIRHCTECRDGPSASVGLFPPEGLSVERGCPSFAEVSSTRYLSSLLPLQTATLMLIPCGNRTWDLPIYSSLFYQYKVSRYLSQLFLMKSSSEFLLAVFSFGSLFGIFYLFSVCRLLWSNVSAGTQKNTSLKKISPTTPEKYHPP